MAKPSSPTTSLVPQNAAAGADGDKAATRDVAVSTLYHTPKSLAKALELNPKTIYLALVAGEIPGARRIRGRWRIHGPTVLAWFASASAIPPSKGGAK